MGYNTMTLEEAQKQIDSKIPPNFMISISACEAFYPDMTDEEIGQLSVALWKYAAVKDFDENELSKTVRLAFKVMKSTIDYSSNQWRKTVFGGARTSILRYQKTHNIKDVPDEYIVTEEDQNVLPDASTMLAQTSTMAADASMMAASAIDKKEKEKNRTEKNGIEDNKSQEVSPETVTERIESYIVNFGFNLSEAQGEGGGTAWINSLLKQGFEPWNIIYFAQQAKKNCKDSTGHIAYAMTVANNFSLKGTMDQTHAFIKQQWESGKI